MSASKDHHDDELVPEQTEGFKVGEKKTIDEYHKLGKTLLCCLHVCPWMFLQETRGNEREKDGVSPARYSAFNAKRFTWLMNIT